MRKTTSYPSSSSDALSVDTAGLQKMLNSGRQTATQIGMAAGAKFCVEAGDKSCCQIAWRPV